MPYNTIRFEKAYVEIFSFTTPAQVKEYHAIVHATHDSHSFEEQLEAVNTAAHEVLSSEMNGAKPLFRRYFLSDIVNQTPFLKAASGQLPCARSAVQQSPLDGTKVALWFYAVSDAEVSYDKEANLSMATHAGLRHLWVAGQHGTGEQSREQTQKIFERYIGLLGAHGMKLADECIRTWFFVSDIDNRYAGMVEARNEAFDAEGLTDQTHYLSSTGIGGAHANPKTFVHMDAYAIGGVQKKQIRFLYALDHLSRTSDYGVRFERGTRVDYADRRHVYISGTASIDSHGHVVHVGDIRKQVDRMLENVEALLCEAECTFVDVAQMIVYLRDPADYALVKSIYDERFPEHPKVFVMASVCRPTWLIEMEVIAVRSADAPDMPAF